MKPIFILLKNFKNLLPYFLLIALYFFFINLETRKYKDNYTSTEKENESNFVKPIESTKQLRITIPVIPYEE